eukprot:scaffold283379_cov19-Tisochrysis_lutea.AAC.1
MACDCGGAFTKGSSGSSRGSGRLVTLAAGAAAAAATDAAGPAGVGQEHQGAPPEAHHPSGRGCHTCARVRA